jgi:hypothetical protein
LEAVVIPKNSPLASMSMVINFDGVAEHGIPTIL